ncbi:hypothetical protein A3F65_03025 [Candidatus Saccharibacteria bacterium RIFCSPHIGHO2_12_FULL_47_16b]|nr:MAG: hypothetical protein A3F65_03025 [Candidatus Saccharibacteria bacterium RIFCSPHIGHO2_12_FULL_47_16b]
METTQQNNPSSQSTQVDSTSLAPEIVEDLPVKAPASGSHLQFHNSNPFKPSDHHDNHPTARSINQPSQPQPMPIHNPQVGVARKPLAETVLIITLGTALSLAAAILLR